MITGRNMSLFNPLYVIQGRRNNSPRRPAPPVNTHTPSAKPLAGNLLEHEDSINPQHESNLFALPREVRDIIWTFTLYRYEQTQRPYNRSRRYCRPGTECAPRIAIELLHTCKAIYMETFLLPVLLNGLTAYHGDADDVPAQFPMYFRPAQSPWQFCAVRELELSLQQAKLEDDWVGRYAIWLMAAGRQGGMRITESPVKDIVGSASSAKFLHRKTFAAVMDESARIRQHSLAPTANPPFEHQSMAAILDLPPAFSSRWRSWYVPRRITKLTLCLGRTDWWTWTADPEDAKQTLALDPGFGDYWAWNRPTQERMLEEAEKRRNGTWAGYQGKCWGAQVCMFPSLKSLELVLETFAAKEKQLDTVVECAKAWTFDIDEGVMLRYQSCSSSSWRGAGEYGYERMTPWLPGKTAREQIEQGACEFVVRRVRYSQVRVF